MTTRSKRRLLSLLLLSIGLLAAKDAAARCDSNSLLECIPPEQGRQCAEFIEWGSAATDPSIRILKNEFLQRPGSSGPQGKILSPGLTMNAVVYGCYSRGLYENEGFSDQSERLMFLRWKYRPGKTIDVEYLPFFPASNPKWKRWEQLVHYRLLGVRDFRGAGADESQVSHILFVHREFTGENPCCDGGEPQPRGIALHGYRVGDDAVTEVFAQTIDEQAGGVDCSGEGSPGVTKSTVTFSEAENLIRIESELIRHEYHSPPKDQHAGHGEGVLAGTTQEKRDRVFRWNGTTFEEVRR